MKILPKRPNAILSIVLLFFILNTSSAQNNLDNPFRNVLVPIVHPEEFVITTCTSVSPNGCNYIGNNHFTPLPLYYSPQYIYYANPFNYDWMGGSLITSWLVGNGSPTVFDGIIFNNPTPPPASSGYFFGATGYNEPVGGYFSESIVQKIPVLIPSKAYTLSFYKMFKDYSLGSVDHFNVVLMKCQDYAQTFVPITYQVPSLPSSSQTIYCETSVSNSSWEQVFIKFIPNDSYDMIWIYPEQNHNDPNKQSGIFVSLPELIDISNFNAGPPPNPAPPNCNVTIGPSSPNCGPTGAVFTWIDPNGLPHPAQANQQIQVDASDPANVGTWKLWMTMPNAVLTNSSCGIQEPSIYASVYVPNCIGTCPPQILPSSFFDPWCQNPHQPIIPYTLNYYCVPWECGGITNLESNYNSGNEWYINDVLITGNGGNIPGVGNVLITNNTQKLYHSSSSASGSIQLFKFQLKNNSQGCIQLTTPTYIYYGETYFPATNNNLGSYKANYTKIVSTPLNFSAGPGSIYTWSIPNTVITDVDNTTPQASVYFPSNIPTPTVNGILTVTNSQYCNGTYNVYFYHDPNLFAPERVNNANKKQSSLVIFPNPASYQVTISSDNLISQIEISDLMNPVLKKIPVNNTKNIVINLLGLTSGIYNCKVTTDKGIENRRLIIK